MTGDFNDVPDSEAVQMMKSPDYGFVDAAGENGNEFTTHKFRETMTTRTIDYVFFRPGAA